jgi:hypothetical protein
MMLTPTLDWVAWQKWDDYENSLPASKSHAENPEDPSVTLCGVRIPESGNGTEVGAGSDYGAGICKRCQQSEWTMLARVA